MESTAVRCMQVVPGLLWQLVDSIVAHSRHLPPVAPRIELSALRDAAKLKERSLIASQASKVAALSTGIRTLDR